MTRDTGPRYADDFLRMLGAKDVTAMDYCDYEGAQILHDLNARIPEAFSGQFDVVLDAGTLEHVFDFAVAIKNCIDLVKCGGHLIIITPVNNYCGHGFYQFSPDLFFRTLSESNGFQVERSFVWEESPSPVYYAVKDPARVSQHPHLVSRYPILMLIQAKKTAQVGQLARPQQSGYVKIWKDSAEHGLRDGASRRAPARSMRKRFLNFIYDRYPKASRPVRIVHRWQQLTRERLHTWRWLRQHSLAHEPGYERLGRRLSIGSR